MFCGTCEFYCPSGAIHQTNDWRLAHLEAEKFTLAEHGLIPNQICVECGGKGLDTAPNVVKVRPPLRAEEYARVARPLSQVPQQVSQDQGEAVMTRLPADAEARLAAAAPTGIEYASTTSASGVVTAWCGLANSEELLAVGKMLLALGARLAMASAMQLPTPEEEEEETKRTDERRARSRRAKAPKEPPKTFGGTPLDGKSMRSTITSCSAAIF